MHVYRRDTMYRKFILYTSIHEYRMINNMMNKYDRMYDQLYDTTYANIYDKHMIKYRNQALI